MAGDVEHEVRRALGRYAFALDGHDPDGLAAVLTEDATWTFTVAGRPGPGPVTGRAAILEFVREAAAGQAERRRHHLTNVVVDDGDGTTAVARAYLLLTTPSGVAATGSYTITLRRDDDRWRIATLRCDLDG
ncbi:nuclear transport factor 2 family protein [Catenuloplanes atrovinosus]|uniref:Uncharacterized protein (TIGR02246 family) n=1 Tax=Catenuloplanes atrovinosus TaxID=137266 RepID=A0AAE3YLS7_9ACTN|nr:nuclear transport factor 2 family protein [Catenuloplanes atrovinosus]MDR7275332.1 uncharacterized protein (TIGR02246 family) [Catenuloplanes atrovinosus]